MQHHNPTTDPIEGIRGKLREVQALLAEMEGDPALASVLREFHMLRANTGCGAPAIPEGAREIDRGALPRLYVIAGGVS